MRTLLGLGLVALLALPAQAQEQKAESQATSDDNIIGYTNQIVEQGWKDNEYSPSNLCADGKWIRRLFLDLLGRIPTYEETTAFVKDPSEDKRRTWVNKLIYSEKYEMEFARNWTTIWTNILIGRTGGNDNERPVNRAGLQKYLRDSFLRNKPYDKMVYELIAATGSNTPGAKDFNGATNFLLDNFQEMQVPATNKVSQIFLGMRIGCTQCHNHPFNEWKQDAFWSFNAFFKQMKPLRTYGEGREIESAILADEDFAGEDGNVEEAAIYYELRNGLLKVAYPVFVDGTKISPVGYVEDVNRRKELAKLVQKSPYTREAIVNRLWGHFMGYGFTKPVDDMGPHNPPSHPDLIEKLGKDFQAYGYDMRRLMKWITLSKPYQLSSKMNATNKNDAPDRGEVPMFSRFYIRQMESEQLYETLMVATRVDKTGKTYEEREQIKNKWMQQFVMNFGTDENDELTTFNGTIPQALELMNGELMKKACQCEPGSFLHHVVTKGGSPSSKISMMYMAALGRAPSSNEVKYANALVQAREGDIKGALQDIWWALLNSNEFILVH